jgi:hypothetical protein
MKMATRENGAAAGEPASWPVARESAYAQWPVGDGEHGGGAWSSGGGESGVARPAGACRRRGGRGGAGPAGGGEAGVRGGLPAVGGLGQFGPSGGLTGFFFLSSRPYIDRLACCPYSTTYFRLDSPIY